MYQRTLLIKETWFGRDHLDVATALNNMVLLFVHQGRQADAQPLYQRSLAIYEKKFGPDHPQVDISLNNLAECRHRDELP
jgi:hypothetical protein